MFAYRLALDASNVDRVAQQVGEMDPHATGIIISKTGALAVRGADTDLLLECRRLIEFLDGGNWSAAIPVDSVQIS